MDGVSDAAAIGTLIQLATTIISYVKNVIDAPVQKRKLLVGLVQARGLLSTLDDLTKDVDDEGWSCTIQNLSVDNGPLSTFRNLLERIATNLDVTPRPGSNFAIALNRLKWPFDRGSLQEMVASLEQFKSHFLLAIANDRVRLSMAIRNELQEVHCQLTRTATDTRRRAIVSLSREQELIVESLSYINLSGKLDGEEIMQMKTNTEWFLQHNDFRQWHDANSAPSTLVLTGSAGSGKTTICEVTRFLLKARHHSEVDVCVVHVAFDFSRREQRDEAMVLSTIVKQMVLERPYLMEHVDPLRLKSSPLSLSDSIDLIRRARYDLKQFYLIFDGLDEIEEVGRTVVEKLLAIEPSLNILVGTRMTSDLSETFCDYATINIDDAVPYASKLGIAKELLRKERRIVRLLDHNPENIANAAKLISHEPYAPLKPSPYGFTLL